MARGGGVADRRKKKRRTAKEKRREEEREGPRERQTAEVNKWKRWNGDGHRSARCIWCIPAVCAAPRGPRDQEKKRDSGESDGEREDEEGVAVSERAGKRRESETEREREIDR